MKRIITIALFSVLAVLAAVSCRKEPEQTIDWRTELQVVKSNLVFLPAGGTETLEVNLSNVNVTADKSWCSVSVSGNTVSVTVPANDGKLSRYAKLTISSGSENVTAAVIQYGEVFDGMELVDMEVTNQGGMFAYPYTTNLAVDVKADQPWVHISFDEENPIVYVTVDKHEGFGTRFATVTYTAGSNSGSAQVIQEPTYGPVSGWVAEDTDGRYAFPDQVDEVTVTPPADLASAPYFWTLGDPNELLGKDLPTYIREAAAEVKAAVEAGLATLSKGADAKEYTNLPSTATAVIIVFDDKNYPTGQYVVMDVAIPDRGPKKQLVDGWEIAHADGSWLYPTQTDVFTIAPKAGYENLKYIATVVKKDAVTNVEDFAFTNFAMSTREEILAKVASGELPDFDAGLNTGTTTLTVENEPGDVYVVVVAFGDNQFYTGDYAAVEMNVADLMPTYYKWAGKWTLTGTYFDNTTYSEVVTISVDENDRNEDGSLRERRLIISGLASKAVAAWGAPEEINQFYLKYDAETGAITFYGQNSTGTFTRSGLGEGCKLQFMSMYVKEGATAYTNATGFDIMSATLDGESAAQITILERSAGLPWLVARIRCLNAENSAYTTTGANDASIKLDKPLTMTRAD